MTLVTVQYQREIHWRDTFFAEDDHHMWFAESGLEGLVFCYIRREEILFDLKYPRFTLDMTQGETIQKMAKEKIKEKVQERRGKEESWRVKRELRKEDLKISYVCLLPSILKNTVDNGRLMHYQVKRHMYVCIAVPIEKEQ